MRIKVELFYSKFFMNIILLSLQSFSLMGDTVLIKNSTIYSD